MKRAKFCHGRLIREATLTLIPRLLLHRFREWWWCCELRDFWFGSCLDDFLNNILGRESFSLGLEIRADSIVP